MANNVVETLVRPTEAQLRWAQFHHKRRAIRIREFIDALYQTPSTCDEVLGSLPDDGNSSSSSNGSQMSDNTREIRRRRPRVSQGRRALLRVSRRGYAKRREIILQNGFQGMTLQSCAENDAHHRDQLPVGDEDSDFHEDALDELFMAHPTRRRRKRRNNPAKEESFRRFQEACHAMIMNLTAPPKHSIIIPSRKWTRTVDPTTALDDEYLDPKWGIRRHGPTHTPEISQRSLAPMDRGATWMMHLPKHVSKARENPYHHDPTASLPPSTGSHTIHDSDHLSNTLPLQAPGAQKFSHLVALVQQRMIQQHREKIATTRTYSGEAQKMKMRISMGEIDAEMSNEIGNFSFSEDADYPKLHDLQDPHAPSTSTRERKAHYIPRIRLRDFVAESTTNDEVDALERILIQGDGVPPKMKLRRFPNNASSPPHQKSRARELAEAFEPKLKDRRLSKTRIMAQSLERIQPKHPTMRLRQGFEVSHRGDDEKKLSDDGPNTTPCRRNHSTSTQSTVDPAVDQSQRLSIASPNDVTGHVALRALNTRQIVSQSPLMMNMFPNTAKAIDDVKTIIKDPPRRRSHPMSEHFVQMMQTSQIPLQKPPTKVKSFPPGTCCTRCAKPSPVASHEDSCFGMQNGMHSRVNEDSSGEFVGPIQGVNNKLSNNSARVSDFFSKLRSRDKDAGLSAKGISPSDESSKQFPDMVVQGGLSNCQSEDVVLEKTDFFAQVREMMATGDDDDETASRRVSDFFAQLRQIAEEYDDAKQDHACLLCEKCQEDCIDTQVEHPHANSEQLSYLARRTSEPIPITGAAVNADDDTKSQHSAISTLWNRGRTSLNSFASSMHAISEMAATVPSSGTNATRLSATDKTGRVESFFHGMHGKKEIETSQDDANNQNIHVTTIVAPACTEKGTSGSTAPKQLALDYSNENDLEAMAAYRKSQEHKRLSAVHDDGSSHSSFHVLPDDIREVVKRQGSSPLTNGRESYTSGQIVLSQKTESNEVGKNPRQQRVLASKRGSDEMELQFVPSHSNLPRSATASPSRDSFSEALAVLSPEKYREAHDRVLQNSPIIGKHEQEIIDTDGTTSDASDPGLDPRMLAGLMLSPDLLQKRLHQAICAVEEELWDNVIYLLKANPWLSEMCELTTNQYLLHKISFFGGTASLELCEHIIDMYPPAVYKLDQDGNVPLHLAAASGHLKMIRMLGERFESGASIRNEDGMLPLHFSIASYRDYDGEIDENDEENENNPSPLHVVKTLLSFFPKAVAIVDNDGNLPIHVAAECLQGAFGVEVIYILLDEADRQLRDPQGARFFNKVKVEDLVDHETSSPSLPNYREIKSDMDEDIHCNMVKNEFGETPLLAAVRCRRGWDVIEALVSGPGGRTAALLEDSQKNNVLHLLLGAYHDPAAALSILKVVPETATLRNCNGMLPIEIACLQRMPEEVILSIALVDLPFDIEDKNTMTLLERHGGSWWFLACECDDHYVHIVQQIVLLCSFKQVRELCFAMCGPSHTRDSVISRATPKCKQVLEHALRFLGRFEFLSDSPLQEDSSIGLQVFDALDFANMEENDEGRRVILKCYSMADTFLRAIANIRDILLDPVYVEEIQLLGDIAEAGEIHQHLCIAIECPQISLERVVDAMVKKGGYQHDVDLRKKYAAKMCAVLRLIAKAIRYLHRSGVIHGNICMANCGKFEHSWKLLDCIGLQRIGDSIDPIRFHQSFPPEVLQIHEDDERIYDSDNSAIAFRDVEATPSIDIWAFGKLAYEALVGKPLVEFDPTKKTKDDVVSLLEILEWDQESMKRVFTCLLDGGVTESCAELVTSCLFPRPEDRPIDMDVILEDPFWKDMRQYRERSSPSKRSRDDAASSTFTPASSKSIFTETASAVDTSQEVEIAEI